MSRQQFNEQIGAQTNLLQGLDRQVGENRVTCAAVEDQMNQVIERCEKIEAKLPEEQAPVEDDDGENNLLAVLEKMNVQNKNP